MRQTDQGNATSEVGQIANNINQCRFSTQISVTGKTGSPVKYVQGVYAYNFTNDDWTNTVAAVTYNTSHTAELSPSLPPTSTNLPTTPTSLSIGMSEASFIGIF